MPAQLTPLNAGTAPTIALQRPVLLIGRHPECDVRLDLSKISRRHCCIALAYDRVMIRDLGSRNGLRVNGRLVDEAQLQLGDEIAIGPLIYRFDDLNPLPSPSSKPSAAKSKPPSLPDLSNGLHDPDGDLVPLDL